MNECQHSDKPTKERSMCHSIHPHNLKPQVPKRKKRLRFPCFLCSPSCVPHFLSPSLFSPFGLATRTFCLWSRHCLLSRLSKGSAFVCLVKPMVTVYVIIVPSPFFFVGRCGWHGAYFALGCVSQREGRIC